MSVSINTPSTRHSESGTNSLFELDLLYYSSLFESKKQKKPKETQKELICKQSQSQVQICCICGSACMLYECEVQGCLNSFHLFCISYYFPELLGVKKICPSHSFKHLDECSKLVHLSNLFSSSSSVLTIVRNERCVRKQADLTGNFFWFGICQQYFPFFHTKKPIFSDLPSTLPYHIEDDSWVSQELTKICTEIKKNSESNLSILKTIEKPAINCTKNPKPGENLQNSSRIPLNLQGKFIRKYEKAQIRSYKFALKDYRSFLSDDKILCAVCDDGDSSESNLIIICGGCNVPVHTKCYRVGKVPENEWLCEPCKAQDYHAACVLCPILGGALKFSAPKDWVHVTCGRLLGNFVKDSDFDVRKIEKLKFKLKCFSCGIKKGACIQCTYGRCANAFHVECRKDLLEKGQIGFICLCPTHKASKLTRIVKSKQELSLEFVKEIANTIWKKFNIEKEPVKRKYVKRKKPVDGNKKKIVVEICQGIVLVKVFSGNKLKKVVKYVEEKEEKIVGKRKSSEVELVKMEKGEVGVKVRMGKDVIEALEKKRKCCEA